MTKNPVNRILLRVAKENKVSLDTVRSEIAAALEEAQKSTNPQVRSRWASIPRKGKQITLEEFLEYACKCMDTTPF